MGGWAATSAETGVPSSQHLDCFSAGRPGGDDVAGKLEEVREVQRACQQMQETARSIAKGVPFNDKAGDGSAVHCVASVAGGGGCDALNCYSADVDLERGLRALRARNEQCRLAGEYL